MNFSFLWIILAMADYGAFHSLMASTMVKSAVEKQYPVIYMRYYRLGYNIVAVVTLIPIGLLVYLLPDRLLYTLPFPLNIVALLAQAAAALGALLTLMGTGLNDFLGVNQILGVQSVPGKLKTDGLYRLVRHPVYTLGFIIMWLLPWMTVNRLALIISTSIYMVIGAHLEERRMLREFGEEYAQYKQRTPMFFPGKGNFSSMD